MELTGFSGTTALVTGAAQGIGEGIVEALANNGAAVGLLDRDEDKLMALAARLEREGTRTVAQAVDISNAEQVEAAVSAVEAGAGPIGGLVNVAGIQILGELVDYDPDAFNQTMAVNLGGTFLVTRAVAKRMVKRKEGAIVTITSNASRVPRVRQGAYCASKAGLSHLMRVFALELAPHGIRCNSVAPGSTETEMIRRMARDMGFQEQLLKGSLENFRVGIPLGKNAQIEEVVSCVMFLLSEQASHVTMHEMVVDGGGSLGA